MNQADITALSKLVRRRELIVKDYHKTDEQIIALMNKMLEEGIG